MCVVQRSQKQKRERERERERENATTRKECSRYYLVLYVLLSYASSFRAYTERFSKKLSKLFCGDDELKFFFFSSSLVSFFKIFSRICLTDALEKNDSLTKKKRNSPPPPKKRYRKEG